MKLQPIGILILVLITVAPQMGCTADGFDGLIDSIFFGSKGKSNEPGISKDEKSYRWQQEQLSEWRHDFDKIEKK